MSQDYDGPRDAAGIINYMKKNAGPSSVQLKDVDHLTMKLDNANDILVVGMASISHHLSLLFFNRFINVLISLKLGCVSINNHTNLF